MIDVLLLFQQITVMVLMIIPGILLVKCHLSTEGLGKGLANIVLYAAQPALIIAGFVSVDYSPVILKRMLVIFILALLLHLGFFGISCFCYCRSPESHRRVLVFATTFTNAGYIGIPLLCALFGTSYPEVAIYASVYVTAFNLYMWSLGAYIFTGDKSYISVKKMLLNPATVCTYIGLGIFFLTASPAVRDTVIVPVLRQGTIIPALMNGLKGLVAPLAMLMVGLRLAQTNWRNAFCDKYLYLFLLLSLFVCPTLSYGCVRLLSLTGIYNDTLTLSVLLISTATPAATATSMFAEKYDGDTHYASLAVSFSSVLCVVTMPIVSLLGLF